MQPTIIMTETPEPHKRECDRPPVDRFQQQSGQSEDYRPLVIILFDPDSGGILGGLWGETNFAHLHVDLLFVPETLRGSGLGRQMLLQAEQEAKARGCRGVWLDTYSFQARGFYERLGYTVFGILNEYPPGQSRIFLHKALIA
jgi:GNAT superfamily N-acetyltransferase